MDKKFSTLEKMLYAVGKVRFGQIDVGNKEERPVRKSDDRKDPKDYITA